MSHNNNVVIISAHPDDMEIGMGATVAKLVESIAVITSVAEQTVVGPPTPSRSRNSGWPNREERRLSVPLASWE
jgi:LmbE family N-acetylglucosaminyl deacetylase